MNKLPDKEYEPKHCKTLEYETHEVYELVLKHYACDKDGLRPQLLEEPIHIKQMINYSLNFNGKSFVINDMFNRLKSFVLEKIKND